MGLCNKLISAELVGLNKPNNLRAESPPKAFLGGGFHADGLAATVTGRSTGTAGVGAGLAACMVGAVLFTGACTRFAGFCTEFTEGGTEWRVSGHQRDAQPAKINAIKTGLDAACHVLGMLKTGCDTFFTLNDAGLTGGDTGIVFAHFINPLCCGL